EERSADRCAERTGLIADVADRVDADADADHAADRTADQRAAEPTELSRAATRALDARTRQCAEGEADGAEARADRGFAEDPATVERRIGFARRREWRCQRRRRESRRLDIHGWWWRSPRMRSWCRRGGLLGRW